jgi:RNA polymerase sigma factor (sigma-70 family)
MDREVWEQWRDARGARKKTLLSKLLADNEPLVRYYVARFSKNSNYYTENMEDDLLQAARIGIIRALPAWEPDKGGFSAVGYWWALHEMQQVVRHATGLSVPKSAFLSRAKQDEASRFAAVHGREPEPEEIGLTEQSVDRHRKAMVECVPLERQDLEHASEVADNSVPDVEVTIDRKRDMGALQEFLEKLPKKDQRDFWAGDRPDLAERAKRFVEGRRTSCRTMK